MPTMPKRLPRIDVVGWLRPFSAWMKQMLATRYSSVTRFRLTSVSPAGAATAFGLSFFLNISSIRRVTRKPPKTLTAASATASTPIALPSGVSVSAAASIAPTMTIAEIALVTAISGVCSAGVTVQTTW